jgi:tRNA modification GTPase
VFSTTDTIVAIATPPGRGGIGVVRVSGPDAPAIVRRLVTYREALEPRYATLTRVRLKPDSTRDGTNADTIDHAIVTYFPAPHSYTGDDVVEISAHGSPVVLRSIVAAAVDCGARLAEPGEFTLRAFLNGRIDLMQAEAVADLIDAATPLQARAAFDQLEGTLTRTIGDMDAALFDLIARLEASVDFPEEGYHFVDPGALAAAIDTLRERCAALLADARRGRLIREGLLVAIVGRPNVGKSSLFNALVGSARAIVTDVPGTTRDLVTETVDLDGIRVTLVDTAGLREATDPIEAEGVLRSMQSVGVADLVLEVVVEGDSAFAAAPFALGGDVRGEPRASANLVVRNKSDLQNGAATHPAVLSVSAKTGAGIDDLRRAIVDALGGDVMRDRPEITNVRHIALVQRAHDALTRARDAAASEDGALSEEFVLADLQDARGAFEEITGRRAAEDVLVHIFEKFCIGK